ncbi:DNA repair protein RecO [Flammeovirga sp. MY04]|uniref:DNA repair protein RecO n=1 Tax=Flammeovirga sp. MY04 TaxID=1191459 RepID=UPI0008268541|nr:DNA repair protein RecO [Flammeovirga sp. MY04]QJD09420.1 DNA repair protein RecO [Flammeovirga sp. MY04]
MIESTKGIVLSNMRYRDSSLIAHVYTEKFGRRDYIIKGAFSKKNNKASFYLPLNILDLQVYEKGTSTLMMVKEARISKMLMSLRTNPQKSMILTFLSELLEKTLRADEIGNPELYQFLEDSLISLDELKHNWNSFTLQFMFRLSHHLGIDITSASLLLSETQSLGYMDSGLIKYIDQLIELPYKHDVVIPLSKRREIMDQTVKFYTLQLPNFGELNSLKILREMGESLRKNRER